MYAGNWKLLNGMKVKHGHGKITFPGVQANNQAQASQIEGFGAEEYEGDWEDDMMNGYGTYKYTNGSIYSG